MVGEAGGHRGRRIAFLLDNLAGGGAERVVLSLAAGFASRGYDVDLLVCEVRGELRDSIPDSVNLVPLAPSGRVSGLRLALAAARRDVPGGVGAILATVLSARKIPRSLLYIAGVHRYLAAHRPAVLVSVLPKANICAVLAAGGDIDTRVYVGVHNALSVRAAQGRRVASGQLRHMLPLLASCYRRAHGVIATSAGVAEDAMALLDLDPAVVHVVHNPVAAGPLAGEGPAHPWLSPGMPPVVLGIGRLVEQKNFELLISAFARVRQQRDARLIIVGGDDASPDQRARRLALTALAEALGVGANVDLVGYRPNPQDYLARAAVFVLSSRHEGFGNVLVEALLAGCPVVSTDCPSGPADILAQGAFGRLVPVDDREAMAQAILATLDDPPCADSLRMRGRDFSVDNAVAAYRTLLFGGA